MKRLFLFIFLFNNGNLFAQQIKKEVTEAYRKLTAENIFHHASISFLVINNADKTSVIDINSETGLAPASCQKVITAATSYELLGHDYTYKTTLGYTGNIVNGTLNGDIIITGSGDPTLGSWRYAHTTEDAIISEFSYAASRYGIHEITGHVYADESLWKDEVTPGGWIWEDIGNYYGAGARALNWRENQYDVVLQSGKDIGDTIKYVGTKPQFITGLHFKILATAAAKGSGDNAYIYMPQFEKYSFVRGTIPVYENNFTISGSMPQPAKQLAITLESALKKIPAESVETNYPEQKSILYPVHNFYTHSSPPLDSIMFWFLKRSINLYGESLIKTLGYTFTKAAATDSGVSVIQNFWSKKGIEKSALNIIDGSGLSPGNRVTTRALVTVMQHAEKQKWFPSFYNALPEINGIKMKSGSIGGVVSYTGYIKSKTGNEYTFAFIINNFTGSADEVRKKMWALLDVLK